MARRDLPAGVEKTMTIQCKDCEGTGTMEGGWEFDAKGSIISWDVTCEMCRGKGVVDLDEEAFVGID